MSNSIKNIDDALSRATGWKSRIIAIYGSDIKPAKAVPVSSLVSA